MERCRICECIFCGRLRKSPHSPRNRTRRFIRPTRVNGCKQPSKKESGQGRLLWRIHKHLLQMTRTKQIPRRRLALIQQPLPLGCVPHVPFRQDNPHRPRLPLALLGDGLAFSRREGSGQGGPACGALLAVTGLGPRGVGDPFVAELLEPVVLLGGHVVGRDEAVTGDAVAAADAVFCVFGDGLHRASTTGRIEIVCVCSRPPVKNPCASSAPAPRCFGKRVASATGRGCIRGHVMHTGPLHRNRIKSCGMEQKTGHEVPSHK